MEGGGRERAAQSMRDREIGGGVTSMSDKRETVGNRGRTKRPGVPYMRGEGLNVSFPFSVNPYMSAF